MKLLVRLVLILSLAVTPAVTVVPVSFDEDETETAPRSAKKGELEAVTHRPRAARLRTSSPRPARRRPFATSVVRSGRGAGRPVLSARSSVPPPLVC